MSTTNTPNLYRTRVILLREPTRQVLLKIQDHCSVLGALLALAVDVKDLSNLHHAQIDHKTTVELFLRAEKSSDAIAQFMAHWSSMRHILAGRNGEQHLQGVTADILVVRETLEGARVGAWLLENAGSVGSGYAVFIDEPDTRRAVQCHNVPIQARIITGEEVDRLADVAVAKQQLDEVTA